MDKTDLFEPMKFSHFLSLTNGCIRIKIMLLFRFVMTPHDTWADVDNNFFEKVAALKKKGVTVSVALGKLNIIIVINA